MVFPALIWAAFRFGPPGATLAIAIAAGVAIGVTANDVGPFYKQPIDHRTLSTQVYIAVAALTTLFLSAIVSERERSSAELAEAKRHEGEQAVEERHRIARDLHDSVSQALFSTALHTRTAQKALEQEGVSPAGPLGRALARDRRADEERAERDARAHLRARPRPCRGRARRRPRRSTRSRLGRSGWADDRRARARRPPRALAPRRDAAVRHRARGARQRRQARRREHGVGSRRGSTGARARRDQRRRPRLRPGCTPPRSLRPRVDAQPRGRGRRRS